MNAGAAVTAGLLAYVARAIAGVSVRFACELPDAGRRVYFANHSSHLDFLVIWSSLPPLARAATRPVAAADYWCRGRLRRHFAEEVFRAVLIDRTAAGGNGATGAGQQAVAQLGEALRGGDSLIIFPEGTRGDGEEVAPFKSGLYHLCREWPGLELVPVHLENLNRVLPKGESVPVPLMSRVIFGEPMTLSAGEEKKAFLERARGAVVELR